MRFSLVNLGCRVNRVESDSVISTLCESGWEYDQTAPQAVIVNTCTVTGEAEKKTRKAVRHALRQHPDATLIVTGCAAAMNPEDYLAMDSRVRIVPKNAVVEAALALDESSLHGSAGDAPRVRFGKEFPTRVGIKIQDGCDNACTYCIVHVARGKSVSAPAVSCVEDARSQYLAGAREIVLTGIDLGNYNDSGLKLDGLLRRLLDAAEDARFRISSIEPPSIDQNLIDLLASSNGRVCRHLHIPLQSGSSKVLKEMDRHYSADDFRSLVDRLRSAVPSISLSTDIIVGFPGETEEDFADTLAMVEYCRFSKVHIFRYSKRAGTPAAVRVDQVPAEIAAERAKRLKEVYDVVRKREQEMRLNTSEFVLVEQEGLATTESYFTIKVDKNIPRGTLCEVTIQNLDENGIFSA